MSAGTVDVRAAFTVAAAAVIVATGAVLQVALDPPTAGDTGTPAGAGAGGTGAAGGGTGTDAGGTDGQAGEPVAISLVSATASGAAPPVDRGGGVFDTYDAPNAIDADDATAWCVPGDGGGHFLAVDLGGPFEVTSVSIIPGYAKVDPQTGDDRFSENRRILRARIAFDQLPAAERTFDPPKPRLMRTSIEPPVQTTAVVIEPLDTTPPSQPNRDYTCISNVVVFGRPA
ncbi:MAG TPA: discoidin domain-containing protein [Actinomycetota bacterium]